jgi:Tau95 Triple barrel domain
MTSETTPTVMDSVNLERHLISIEYPGLVNDQEKAVTSLGGIGTLSSTHSHGNRK